MPILHINKATFKTEVLDHKGIVLVDFFAPWCDPCKDVAPILDELAGEMEDVKIVKVNVEENVELASKFSVFSIPTFLVVKDGKVVSQFVWTRGKESIKVELHKAQS